MNRKFFPVFLILCFVCIVPSYAAREDNLREAVRLNESAVQKMQAGNLDGAEFDLLKALAYSNENPHVRKNLSIVYYEKGVRELGLKRLQEAKRYLKMALDIDPDHESFRKGYANVLFYLAEDKVKRGSYREALKLFVDAAEWDPDNVKAWAKAAHYAWTTHDIKAARVYLDKAKSIDPSASDVKVIESEINKSRKESHLTKVVSEHFILVAEPEYLKTVGSHKILYELEEAFQKVSFKLNEYPKDKITVVFYSQSEFASHWRMARTVMGFYDGKLRIPIFGPDTTPRQMQPIIMHELTHAFIDRISKRQLPKWLDEGMAQWVEGRSLSGHMRDALLSHERNHQVGTISDLDRELKAKSTVAYMKAFSFTGYLIEKKGIHKLVSLIKEYGLGKSEAALFEKYYNMSLSRLEEYWLESLESRRF